MLTRGPGRAFTQPRAWGAQALPPPPHPGSGWRPSWAEREGGQAGGRGACSPCKVSLVLWAPSHLRPPNGTEGTGWGAKPVGPAVGDWLKLGGRAGYQCLGTPPIPRRHPPPPPSRHAHTLISHTPAQPTASACSHSRDNCLTPHTSHQTQTTRAFPRPHLGARTQARGPRAHLAQRLTHVTHALTLTLARAAPALTPRLAGFCGRRSRADAGMPVHPHARRLRSHARAHGGQGVRACRAVRAEHADLRKAGGRRAQGGGGAEGQGTGRGRSPPTQGRHGCPAGAGVAHGTPQGYVRGGRRQGFPSSQARPLPRAQRHGQGLGGPGAPCPSAPPRPPPRPGPRCLRAPGTCPSADVPRRWCDCFSAVIFNRL